MTKTDHIRINCQLTFVSAFHFGTGLRQGIVHRIVARDADDYLYVPGSTFKGVLRDRCEQLARLLELQATEPHSARSGLHEAHPDLDIIARIFGTRFYPSRLHFDDLKMSEEDRHLFEPEGPAQTRALKRPEFRSWQTENRTQVTLSRMTGAAARQRLYTSEYGTAGRTFEGQIVGMITGFPLMECPFGTYSLLLLAAALASLDGDRLGGNKSTGAGKVLCEVTGFEVNGQKQQLTELLNHLEELEYYQIARDEGA